MADVPLRLIGGAVNTFRPGPPGSNLRDIHLPPAVGAFSDATEAVCGLGTGTWRFDPLTSAVVQTPIPPVATPASNRGWRDNGYVYAPQAFVPTQFTGPWLFRYLVRLVGTGAITVNYTVIVYAVSLANSTRELFRNTSPNVLVSSAAVENLAQVANPGLIDLDPGEIVQYEFYVTIVNNANTVTTASTTFRVEQAGNQQASIDAPDIFAVPGGGPALPLFPTSVTATFPTPLSPPLGLQEIRVRARTTFLLPELIPALLPPTVTITALDVGDAEIATMTDVVPSSYPGGVIFSLFFDAAQLIDPSGASLHVRIDGTPFILDLIGWTVEPGSVEWNASLSACPMQFVDAGPTAETGGASHRGCVLGGDGYQDDYIDAYLGDASDICPPMPVAGGGMAFTEVGTVGIIGAPATSDGGGFGLVSGITGLTGPVLFCDAGGFIFSGKRGVLRRCDEETVPGDRRGCDETEAVGSRRDC